MSMDHQELIAWEKQLKNLELDFPQIMGELAVGEGAFAVKQARKICTEDAPDIVNTGEYRRSFGSSKIAVRKGEQYIVNVFNFRYYAQHLEYGFRSHFVPGHWEGNTFVYQPNDPDGGMFVGPKNGVVPGHFTLKRAIDRTKATQTPRLKRKLNRKIKQYLKE